MKLSELFPKLMYQLLKNSTDVVGGLIFFRHRSIFVTEFDEEESIKKIQQFGINIETVQRFLDKKYIPTPIADGAVFRHQTCIQKVLVKPDKSLVIFIHHSEPHKIITDTIHVRKILRQKGFEFNNTIKYYITRVQMNQLDVLLYNEYLRVNKMNVPGPARFIERSLLKQFGTLEKVAAMKMRNIKRKIVRYLRFKNLLTNKEANIIMRLDEFDSKHIHEECDLIRKEKGPEFTW